MDYYILAVDDKQIFSAATEADCLKRASDLGLRGFATVNRTLFRKNFGLAPVTDEELATYAETERDNMVELGLMVALVAATSVKPFQKKCEGAKIQAIDDKRWALYIDGVIHFTGYSPEECEARGNALLGKRGPDRSAQDEALKKACW